MHNNPDNNPDNSLDNNPVPDSPRNARNSRRKGCGLPTTVWFSRHHTPNPYGEDPGRPREGFLPDWAVDRLIEEYLADGHSVILADSHDLGGVDPSARFTGVAALNELAAFGTGPAGLAIVEHTGRRELAEVLDAVRTRLAADGILVIALPLPIPGRGFTDHTTAAIRTGRQAGLGYLQHLTVIDAHIGADRIATPPAAYAVARAARAAAGTHLHSRVHHDVLVFTRSPKGAA